jgi:hypothetical protein
MARFDQPGLERTAVETAATWVNRVLMLPGRIIWTSWASRNLPNVLEWILFVANSALWAAAGVAVMTRLNGRRNATSSRAEPV